VQVADPEGLTAEPCRISLAPGSITCCTSRRRSDLDAESPLRRSACRSRQPRAAATAATAASRRDERLVSDRDGTKQIYVANADGTGVTRLTNGEKPALSRDGRRIAFHRQAFPSASWYGVEVYVMNSDGTGEPGWRMVDGWRGPPTARRSCSAMRLR
jgi:hypothetical protein